MPDNVVSRSPMAHIEDRIGVTPIEELLADRQTLVEAVADLRAMYGPFGTFDAKRKVLLATVAMKARATAQAQGAKVTEASLDETAHASPEYTDFITQATLDRSKLTVLESKIEAIDHTITRSNAVVRYVAAEAHL